MGKTKIRHIIGLIGWKIYVRFMWQENKVVQSKLTIDIAKNLGFYLRESHKDFK